MGGTISGGRNNNELVDKLVRMQCLRSASVVRVFRAVDRGDYFLPDERDHAYSDLAWKSGHLHISAPCIYCDVMETLKLRPGQSFLNLGSGTGYLSTMAGLILGTNGTNHGVELHDNVVRYANEKLYEFLANSCATDELDFCEPKFVVGNCLCLPSGVRLYDRVYCGAACPKEYEKYLMKLIKIGGILVMPLDEFLVRVKRTSEDTWITQKLLHVSFSTLITPATFEQVDLPDSEPPSLQILCRSTIRNILRNVIAHEEPELLKYLKRDHNKSRSNKNNPNRVKTFCISIEDENSDSDDFNDIQNLNIESGTREMNALLRLVMSMGNRARDVVIRDLSDASQLLHRDLAFSSSEDDVDMSDFDSSSSSSSSSYHDVSSPMMTDENESNNKPVTTKSVETSSSSSSSDTKETSSDVKPSTSVVTTSSLSSLSSGENSSNSKRKTRTENSSSSSSKYIKMTPSNSSSGSSASKTKSKSDSGIDEESPTTTASEACQHSPSGDTFHLVMTTFGGEDNSSVQHSIQIGAPENRDEECESDQCSQRKRPLPESPDSPSRDDDDEDDSSSEEDDDENDSSDKAAAAAAAPKTKRKSTPTPHPYDVNRKKLSEMLRHKVAMLALPSVLKKYVNMNREF